MALTGEAYIVVRAITNRVDRDIQNGFRNASRTGRRAGETLGDAFSRGFNRNVNVNIFDRVAGGIRSMVPAAEGARRAFANLNRSFQFVAVGISVLLGGISAVIGGLGSLGGAAIGAIGSLSALGNVLFALIAGFSVARLALGGIGQAVSALNRGPTGGGGGGGSTGGGGGAGPSAAASRANQAAIRAVEDAERSLARVIQRNREQLFDANNDVRRAQLDLNEALKEGREEIQQLGFDAEDAAVAEQRAALDLERARETLARVQDLPPNSRIRREAELAFQEAELNLRRARDNSADLNAEQDRLARTGVRGTESVIQATEALAEAERDKSRTVRDGAQDEADAVRALAEARAAAAEREAALASGGAAAGGGGFGGGGGFNPFEGLNDAQIEFAKFIASLKPQFDELSRIASEAFLPKLQTAIEILMRDLYPVVAVGIDIVARAMGNAAISLAEAITTTENLDKLASLFVTSGPLIESLGRILGSAYGIILSILEASAPLAQRYFDFLEERLSAFDDFLNSVDGNAQLVEFFQNAGDRAADFGEIFDNIFNGLGDIIGANIKEGSGGAILLEWLIEITDRFAALGDDLGRENPLNAFFINVAENTKSVVGSVGELIGALFSLADNRAIGDTFDILATGAPFLESILDKLAEAGPSFGELIVTLTEIFDLLIDSDTAIAFFETLDYAFGIVRDFLKLPAVKAFLDFIAPISGVALAVGGLILNFLTAGRIISGFAMFLSGGILGNALKGIIGLMSALSIANLKSIAETLILKTLYAVDMVKALAANVVQGTILYAMRVKEIAILVAQKAALIASTVATNAAAVAARLFNAALSANPIGIIITAITILVGSLIYFFTQTELGKEIWANFTQFLTEAWANIVAFGTEVFNNLSSFFSDTWTNITGFFTDAFNFIIEAFLNWTIFGLIISNWDAIVKFFDEMWVNIQNFFTAAFQFLVDAFLNWTIFGIIISNWEAIVAFFDTVWQNIIRFFTDAFTSIRDTVTNIITTVRTIWETGLNAVKKFFKDIWDGIVGFFQGIVTNVKGRVEGFIAVFKTVIDFLPKIGAAFDTVFQNVVGFIRGAVNNGIRLVEGLVNNVISAINGIIGGINGVAGAVGDAIGVSLRVPTIGRVSLPRLAKGGVVLPSPGGSIVNVAEAGRPERIEPLDAQGFSKRDRAILDKINNNPGKVEINLYPPPGTDNQEIARIVSREISLQMRKGGK